MDELHSILYISSAVNPPSYDQIIHLLTRARERNAAKDITGILLLVDSNFMQYIEGPEQNLKEVFEIIKKDPMHKGIIEIVNEPIQSRIYFGWNMAFASPDFKSFTDPEQYQTLLHPTLTKPHVNPTDIAGLLNHFWNSYRNF
jgi:hypothetical protein